jgi:hypothetical protein
MMLANRAAQFNIKSGMAFNVVQFAAGASASGAGLLMGAAD